MAEQCENKVKIRLQEELRNMPYDFAVGEKATQLKRIATINDMFNVDEINIDATGVGTRLEEDMRRLFGAKVESIIFTSKSKEIMITNLKLLCEKQGIEFPVFKKPFISTTTMPEEIQDRIKKMIAEENSLIIEMRNTIVRMAKIINITKKEMNRTNVSQPLR